MADEPSTPVPDSEQPPQTEILDADAGKQIVRDPKTGQFMPGTNCGGRPRGSFDGINLVRALVDRELANMAREGGEFQKLFEEGRKKPGFVFDMLNKSLKLYLEEMKMRVAAERQGDGTTINVSAQRSVNIIMVQETPPDTPRVKQVENKAHGNGKA